MNTTRCAKLATDVQTDRTVGRLLEPVALQPRERRVDLPDVQRPRPAEQLLEGRLQCSAVLLGTVFALGATESFRHVLNIMIPYPMPLRLDAAAPFAYGAITMAVLLAAASWPAWRTSRLNVVEALRYE